MELSEYQREARRTVVFPESVKLTYTALGLAGEAGEYANKIKKLFRDQEDKLPPIELANELGDVLWYVAACADAIGFTLEEIAEDNIAKLRARKQHGTLHGKGDGR